MTNISHGQYRLFTDDEIGPDTIVPGSHYQLFADGGGHAEIAVRAPAAAVLPANDVAVSEVLGFCPRLLSALPLPTTLVCVRGNGARREQVVITTSQAVYAAAARSWPTFTGRELAAMALAAEHERASPSAFVEWCDRKRRGGGWQLDEHAALGAVPGRFNVRNTTTIGRTLAAYGCVLWAVGVGDELPALPASEVTHAAE
jgi:hypothetical protein